MTVSLEGLYRGESLTNIESEQLFGEVLRGEMDPLVLFITDSTESQRRKPI